MGRMLSSNPRRTVEPNTAPLGTPINKTVEVPVLDAKPMAGSYQLPNQYQSDPFRKIAFYFSLGLLLIRFGVLPEVLYSITGLNTYLLYLVAPPAILGALLAGGLKRTFRSRAAYLWVAFFGWMILATPFSYWQGGSFARIKEYGRVDFLFLIVVGGLAINWKEIRLIFYTIGAAALTNLLTARIFMKTENDRISLDVSTTIGNSNDLAAHLLLVLPFLLFISMDPKRSRFVRLAILASIGYGLSVILGTASRGGLLGIMGALLFFLWHASLRQRLGVIVSAALLTPILLLVLPPATKLRLTTLFGHEHEEAAESASSRAYLFNTSVKFTLEHPLLGVGPDQFSNYEGKTSQQRGEHGAWHVTHCTWTQVSSECGIPALILYLSAIISALLMVRRTFRAARRGGHQDIANACFCYLLAMAGFLVAVTLLASAYTFYFPAMIGLAISMSFVAKEEMAARDVSGNVLMAT